MTRRQTIDERAEAYAAVMGQQIDQRGHAIPADLELAWLAGYRAAKADERAKAKKGKP